MIPVFKPSMGQQEIDAVGEVLRSGWLGLGPKTATFEQRFSAYVGAPHAVATNSCTAALELVLQAIGIAPGEEVFLPALTFVSDAHAVVRSGGRPVFVDVDPTYLTICPEDLQRKIAAAAHPRAIIGVHYSGHPFDLDCISDIARRYQLRLIEDAAHAAGASYHAERIGSATRSDACCFSFHAVKNLAVGDGGMITTRDAELAARLRRLVWCGIDKSTWTRNEEATEGLESVRRYGWYYEVGEVGMKAHGNDITSAIGLVQLSRLDAMNERRRAIAARYAQGCDGLPVRFLSAPPSTTTSQHMVVLRTGARDAIHEHLKAKGIATGVHYMPLSMHPCYSGADARHPVTDAAWRELLTLPCFPDLQSEQVDEICKEIKEVACHAG